MGTRNEKRTKEKEGRKDKRTKEKESRPSPAEVRTALRNCVQDIRKNTGNVPFFAKSPQGRGLADFSKLDPKLKDRRQLFATPATYLAESLEIRRAPSVKGIGNSRNLFASNYKDLARTYENTKTDSLGTSNLDNIVDILLDGCIVANFRGPLGDKKSADQKKDLFSGAHGPFFVFFDSEQMDREIKAKGKRAKANVFSLDCIELIALPEEKHKLYVLKLLKEGVKQNFITEAESRLSQSKVFTYGEVKELKKAKRCCLWRCCL